MGIISEQMEHTAAKPDSFKGKLALGGVAFEYAWQQKPDPTWKTQGYSAEEISSMQELYGQIAAGSIQHYAEKLAKTLTAEERETLFRKARHSPAVALVNQLDYSLAKRIEKADIAAAHAGEKPTRKEFLAALREIETRASRAALDKTDGSAENFRHYRG
ncbi:MAG: hypothetical protein PW734_12220 [Verrucomicrobium sp.]|nr:hypothetical protein [Verrucomicrobium sp.]